ncbi:MAG: aminodeoxychorismate/anthranilate synthase component II [Gemmatimonadaceae bacterium]|nr:aminodeoxychorismate/anthranilate synthase component II [Gemmatimonadaceae bacterium]
MILVIDNYDSFTYNLVQYLGALGAEVDVVRNDAIDVEEVGRRAPAAIVLSPGPGTPADAGITIPVIRRWGATIPILGVCLGHQAIGEAFGGRVVRAPRGVMHGKTSRVAHDGRGLFRGLPSPLTVMRYHSLVVSPDGWPHELVVAATAEHDPTEVHALRHREFPVHGVQFHPESVGTPDGLALVRNFLDLSLGSGVGTG